MGSDHLSEQSELLPNDIAAARAELRKIAQRGLPDVHPGSTLQETLAILIDYLLDNDLVRRCSFERSDDQITCSMETCPLYGNCPLPTDQYETHQLLCELARNTLARAGFPADVLPVEATDQFANVAFQLQFQENSG